MQKEIKKEKNIQVLANSFIETRDERSFKFLYERVRPGVLNHCYGILKDPELAEDAFLASAESRVRQIAELEVRPDLTALEKEIQARSANTGNERSIYGRDYNIEVHVAMPETVAEAKAELARIQKRRRKIKDEMVTINVRTEFEVAEQVALVLTDLGLD